jgi:hypothetical protein
MKRATLYVNLFALIPSLVKLIEVEFGHGNGAEKKQAVTEVAGSILQAGGAAVGANNPYYADAISKVIDATVSTLNSTGQMPEVVPQPRSNGDLDARNDERTSDRLRHEAARGRHASASVAVLRGHAPLRHGERLQAVRSARREGRGNRRAGSDAGRCRGRRQQRRDRAA